MSNATSSNEAPRPAHSHYVSLANDVIYPALSSPAGYEDQHPSEYRPATAAEIEKFKRGNTVAVRVAPLPVDQAPAGATPTSITLADDGDAGENEQNVAPPAPAPAPVPAAPAPVINPAIPPAPRD